jgi:ABC-type long-subunit fatty acid transport system fused permease/ATPase subunit
MFQLCAAEKVNTDYYFTIQVYFKLGLRDIAISDGDRYLNRNATFKWREVITDLDSIREV